MTRRQTKVIRDEHQMALPGSPAKPEEARVSQPAPETRVDFRHRGCQSVRLKVLYLEDNTSMKATSPELQGTSPISSLPSEEFHRPLVLISDARGF